MSDFLTSNIDDLLNSTEPAKAKEDVNELLARADRELMRFKTIRHTPTWPKPVRKRIWYK